ncbi:MAG: hypothetical protein OES79_03655 [Planctomycetota bacterium]|nr:hypothetical protein [Planctomycetota bacterium]
MNRIFLLTVALATIVAPPAGGQDPRLTRHDAPAGTGRFRPGKWGMVGVNVINPRDKEVRLLVTTHFQDRPHLQYGRQLWLPPRSRRKSWIPVQIPADLPRDQTKLPTRSYLIDRSQGKDTVYRDRHGAMFHRGLLRVDHQRRATGIVSDPEDHEAFGATVAMRLSHRLDGGLAILHGSPLPPDARSLESLNHLVICSDRLGDDAAGYVAIRRWLQEGGRIWIMLDQVRPETVRLLLGDAFRSYLVDRVELSELRIEGHSRGGQPSVEKQRQFADPVPLARVIPHDVEVQHEVDGWPVSFWQRIGRGRVLFTTLAARGWTRLRRKDDLQATVSSSGAVATEPLFHLGEEFLFGESAPPFRSEQLVPYVSEQIGYKIAARHRIGLVLGLFCVSLVACGMVLWRCDQLEHLGWIGPVAAVIAAGLLLGMGRASRTQFPATVASGQLVEVTAGTEDLAMTGLMALYFPEGSQGALAVQRGGVFEPDMANREGKTIRMIWTDLDRWRWENLQLPAGMHLAPFRRDSKIAAPVQAVATFGPNGLQGSISAGPFEDLADAIITTPTRSQLAVTFGDDHRFTAGTDSVLAAGQFLAGTLVSDRQRRRQAALRNLLRREEQAPYAERPTLLTWAAPLATGFEFGEETQQLGAALVAIPLEIERPANNTEFVIPSPLVDYQAIPAPGRPAIGTLYDNDKRVWLGQRTIAGDVYLRFQVPPALLPVEVQTVTMVLAITAPNRTLELLGRSGDRYELIERRDSPVGIVRFEVAQADLLQMDQDGGLRFGLKIGELAGEARAGIHTAGWNIEDVQLELRGRTIE